MRRFSIEELLYALFHFPMALSSPFISWYFFKLSGGDFFGSGLIISLPYLALIFSTVIFGSLSDRFGSKNVVLVALGAYSVSFLSYYLIGDNVNLFFFSYVGFNLIISGFVPAFNRMISFYNEEERSEEFGKLGAMASVGFLFGSLIATLFIDRIGLEMMFSISELSFASRRTIALIKIAWFGIIFAMPFSSPRACLAVASFLSTDNVSVASRGGGRGGTLSYGFEGSNRFFIYVP